MVFSLPLIILLAATMVNIVFAVFVYKNNPQGATNRIFGVLGLLVSLWLIILYIAQHPAFLHSTLIWTRLSIFVAAPMSMMFFLLAHTIPYAHLRLQRRPFLMTLLSTAFVMAINISPYAFTGVRTVEGGLPRPIAGPGMLPFTTLSTFFSAAAVYLLFRRLSKSQGTEKVQFEFVTTGILLMLGLIILTIFLPVVFFNNATLVSLAPLYTLVFLGMTAYAIVQHKLLDIRLLLTRSLSFLLLLGIGAGVYGLVFFVGMRRLLGIEVNTSIFLSAWALTTVATLTFQPLQARLRALTNKLFFKGEYDSDALLTNLTRIMVETIDLEKLTHKILRRLMDDMKIREAAFLIVDAHKIVDIWGIGYESEKFKLSGELEELFHQYIAQNHHFIFDDLPESPLKDIFRGLQIFAAIPIRVEASEVAILVLGTKSSGEIYSEKDIHVLDIFASEAGIAIQNARSYAEIRKLSRELETRVEDRTRQLKNAQERELAKAREVTRLKDEFVFVAAHELRTPVTVIRGFLELVAESTKNFPKDVQENLNAIASASNHLNQLINDLLEIARTEAGAMQITVTPIDLLPVVSSVLKDMTPVAMQRHVALKLTAQEPIPQMRADAQKIREALLNLVSNAIKYNKEGGEVDITVFPQNDQVITEIRDTGYGIPEEDQEKIFQKFFRAHAEGTQQVLGTGLGLFITRMLVEKMGGKISFTSLKEQGTTFAFSFPKA